ncbi:DUF2634 domain-containing protein [Paenibacillus alba]|uniref:DUF2634 domain-containing protein n=1 Tax=Paenibacillus alba TaxID=1197127 RepID=UPI0015658845|nr:DUF2634 domain-containing protein [Paenibacillus alba]NQX68071.1 DUF2634 domain-containing protein [Paenibacillus alba]
MIPQGGAGNVLFQQVRQPSKTYQLDPFQQRMIGVVDGLEAVKQAVYKILQTERFKHTIYGSDYGSEFNSIVGKSASYVKAELGRRIQEALVQDDRILSVDNVKITVSGDSALAEFTVVSLFGNFESTKEV